VIRCATSAAVAALLVAACNGGGAFSPGLPTASSDGSALRPFAPFARVVRGRWGGKIKHIVIVVQENRSFNNLFYGFPGAKTAKFGEDSYGKEIRLRPIGLESSWDIDHSSDAFIAACNGRGHIPGTRCRMNGFNLESVGCAMSCPIPHPQYAYVPHAETRPYFDMAKEWVLADEMFASNFDASSFISHQYIISGQAESAVNYPDSNWGCPGGPSDMISKVGPHRQEPYGYEVVCWNPTTLGDELDEAHVSWAYYAVGYSSGSPGIWSAYQAIKHIYNHADWREDVITPPSQFLTDVANGKLRSVSWVTPTWGNSDHAGSGSKTGPSWVASLVNAIGESKYWDSTVMFIFWDDYGGWYDPAPPAYKDYDGLGMRLPLLIVSPYAKAGYVSHVHYEHGSILKFVEDTFGLERLAASDRRAKSPALDSFNFNAPPRKFVPIDSPYDRAYFLHQPPDYHIPDSE
jgi:phospholipase C